MRVSPEIFESSNEMGAAAAAIIADQIEAAQAAGRSFVLGCPSGRSALTTYEHLAGEIARRGLALGDVVIALMDEYLVQSGGELAPVASEEPHSCVGFGLRSIVAPLSEAAGADRGISLDNFWFPDFEKPGEFDDRLAEVGGIDVFILASGATDGHVALNPVGSSPSSATRVVELGEATRRDNLSTFPSLDTLERVPRFGVTVGVGTIRNLSKSVIMLAAGTEKREAVRRLEAAERYDPEWPATILSECASPRFFIDREARELRDFAA
jgi:glucosamine-6-phosphate deaminase